MGEGVRGLGLAQPPAANSRSRLPPYMGAW